MRLEGKITNWKDDKGFGFIIPDGGGRKLFVHIKSFSNRQRRPIGNETVSYKVTTNAKGQPQAINVVYSGEHLRSKHPSEYNNLSLILAVIFILFVIATVIIGKLPLQVLSLYLFASVVTFTVYAFDKSAAKKGLWRISESTLHLLSLIGGWPGALSAQRFLRHKSKKQSFQIIFWITVLLNCGALSLFFWPSGAQATCAIFHLG